MDQFVDELDSLPTATAKPTVAPAAHVTPQPTQPVNPNVASWDADDTDDVSGTILKSTGIDYVKVKEGMPVRLAFIPGGKMVGAPVHYEDATKRYYICDSKPGKRSKCCEKLGDAKGRAAAYVFVYTNCDPKTGKYATDAVPTVGVSIFTMSKSNWDDVRGGPEEGASVYSVDFRISVSEGQLTRKVAVISRTPRWKVIEAEALATAAPYLANPAQLVRALGRKYEATFSAADATLGDVESL